MSGSTRGAPAPTDPRRGKRVGTAAVVGGLLFIAVAVLFVTGAGGAAGLVLGGSILAALGLLSIIVGGIGFSASSRFPAVKHLGGPIDLARILVLVIGGLGAVFTAFLSPDVVTGMGIVFVIVIATGSTFLSASALRTVLRGPDVVSPAR